jgi:hypothetical protein
MRMTFGKHKGQLVSALPTGYLLWLLREVHDLSPWLRAHAEQTLRDRGQQHRQHQQPPAQKVLALADVRGLVKRWFSGLALRWHPDRGGHVEAMKALNEARTELCRLLEI